MGISTFYPEPTTPSPPIYTRINLDPSDPDFKEKEDAYLESLNQHSKELSNYNRNVSIISLVAAIILLIIGLLFGSKMEIISDSLLLGGVLLLIYSLASGFMNDENIFRFSIVTAGLMAAITVGYFKFVSPVQSKKPKSKKK